MWYLAFRQGVECVLPLVAQRTTSRGSLGRPLLKLEKLIPNPHRPTDNGADRSEAERHRLRQTVTTNYVRDRENASG
jgi:hypothetical protein